MKICKRFRFEAAHKLESAYTACCHETIHGHSYKLDVEISIFDGNPFSSYLPDVMEDGMVMDFGRLKKIVQEEVLDKYDHALILFNNSELMASTEIPTLRRMGNKKIVEVPWNPTAENMVRDILARLVVRQEFKDLNEKVHPVKIAVRLWETEDAYAEDYNYVYYSS